MREVERERERERDDEMYHFQDVVTLAPLSSSPDHK